MAYAVQFNGTGRLLTSPWSPADKNDWMATASIRTGDDVTSNQVILGDGTNSSSTRALRLFIDDGVIRALHITSWTVSGRLELPISTNTDYDVTVGIYGGNFIMTVNAASDSQPRNYTTANKIHLRYIGNIDDGSRPFLGLIKTVGVIDGVTTNRFYDADASDHNSGTDPVTNPFILVDTIGGDNADGIDMDVSNWVNLGGGGTTYATHLFKTNFLG